MNEYRCDKCKFTFKSNGCMCKIKCPHCGSKEYKLIKLKNVR